jgi:hypothetical protein
MLRVQALGMVGFGALALVALSVDPDLGRYLVAAGWSAQGGTIHATDGQFRSLVCPRPS